MSLRLWFPRIGDGSGETNANKINYNHAAMNYSYLRKA